MSGLLEDIRQTLASTPQNVVFIVGAGVSVGALRGSPRATLASWVGLLHDGLRRTSELGALDARAYAVYRQQLGLTGPQAALGVADIVWDRLGAPHGGEFSRWLRETVGTFHHDVRDRAVLDALAAHHRRGALLATTNYDHLLETATALKPATWRRPVLVERALRGAEPRVLHLHGEWEDPESIVLGTRSYVDVTRDPHAQTVLATLRTARTFIFVGCGAGLSDPNLGAFLRWTGEVFARSEARHYRLCLTSELEALRREHPPEQRIFPLPYGDTHADLAPFLRRLHPSDAFHVGELMHTGRGSWAGLSQSSSPVLDSPHVNARSSSTPTTFPEIPEFEAPPRLLRSGSWGMALLAGALTLGALGTVCVLRGTSADPTEPKSPPDVFGGLTAPSPQKPARCAKLSHITGRWEMTTSVNWTANVNFSGASGQYSLDVSPRADCLASIVVRKTGDSGKPKYKRVYQDRAQTRLNLNADDSAVADFEVWLGPEKSLDKVAVIQDGDWHYRFILRLKDGRMEGTWEMFDKNPGGTVMRGVLEGTRSKVLPSPYGSGK